MQGQGARAGGAGSGFLALGRDSESLDFRGSKSLGVDFSFIVGMSRRLRFIPDHGALVEEIEAEAAAQRKRTGLKPPGPAAILTQNPHRQPLKSKKSPAPAFHAASQAVRRELRDAYAGFVAVYRQAAEKLRAGDRNVFFPTGSFPPALPFVGG